MNPEPQRRSPGGGRWSTAQLLLKISLGGAAFIAGPLHAQPSVAPADLLPTTALEARSQGPWRLALIPAAIGRKRSRPIFERARKLAEAHLGLVVEGYDPLFLTGVEPVGAQAVACGSDLACVAERLGPAGYDLGLLITENRRLEPPLLAVELLDVARGAVRSRWVGEATGPEVLDRAIHEALDEGGFAEGGWLVVEVEPEDAVLSPAEPTLGGLSPYRWLLPAGPFDGVATAPGYRPKPYEVEIRPGEEIRVRLVLEPKRASVWRSPWLWTGVGVVVVGGIVGALAGAGVFNGSEAPACACITTPASPPCPPCP